VYVGSDCDNTSYDFWEDYFCVSYHAQYTEDFSQNNLPCWKNKTDEYPNWIRDGLGDFWQIGDFPMDATMGQALFSPNPDYFTSDRVWLISPRIEISGPDANLQMDVAAVDSDNRQYITLASNDTVQVLITTDEGQNWTLLHEWSGNQALSGLTHLQEDLSAYDGLYVRFALTVKLASFTPMAPSSTGTKRVYFDNFQVNGTLNSPEASLDNTWRLYPNPAGESLHWKSKIPVLGVQITDLSGKVLMELNKPKENIIFTGNLSPGVYVLRLTTIEGESARYFIKK
ncbi:MAG: T9SS type A sorting domain-containing protein, partial [Chlorobi bacterium]|nr:T9SS type A sorting domain-containing protein [Chlorobiota bacterium]